MRRRRSEPERAEPEDTFHLIRRWQTYLEVSGHLEENTRRKYRRCLIQFLTDVLIELPAVTEDDVVTYLATLSRAMRGQLLRALKSFYGWAARNGVVAADPTEALKITNTYVEPLPALSEADTERLLQAAATMDPRARPTIQLMLSTGGRVGSICEVLPEDVDLDAGTIAFKVAKGWKPYSVPLSERGRTAAMQLLELIDFTPTTVTTRRPTLIGVGSGRVWQWIHEAAQRAGVTASPHTLRRTFGTRLAENPSVDIRTFVQLMNHADGSQLRRYAQASDPHLRAAVETL